MRWLLGKHPVLPPCRSTKKHRCFKVKEQVPCKNGKLFLTNWGVGGTEETILSYKFEGNLGRLRSI